MTLLPSPRAIRILLQDAIERDLTTARRAALLHILWNERFLTRSQLIIRVEYQLGTDCFGVSAWEDAFFRDMRVVKKAFQKVGLVLEYSRKKEKRGYYVQEQDALSLEFKQLIKAGAAEVDQRQMDIYRKLSPAARFKQGCAISNTARNVVAYRIRQENPKLTPQEAQNLALQRTYTA